MLKVARVSAVVAAVAGLGMALVLPTVVDALKIFYSLLTVALFVPLVAGLSWPRATSRAAMASIAVATPLSLAVHVLTAGHGVDGVPPVVLGLLVSAATFAARVVARRSARDRGPAPVARFGDRSAVEDVTFDVGRARSSACSARTAQARRRRCGCWRD